MNATVRARVRATWWCLPVANPHFGKIVPKYKAIYRLYFTLNVDAKNIPAIPRKLPFMWCYVMVEMLAQSVHISPQTLGKMSHRFSHFRSYFQKMKTVFMFKKLSFLTTLKEFLKNSNPLLCYRHFSKLLSSKPLQNSARTCAARYSRQRTVLGPLLFLIFINDLVDGLTCNHLFCADDVKLITPRSQQHELRSLIRQAFNWSHRWDLPLNASKIHHLSIGGTPDLRIALSKEAAGNSLEKCEQINDLGITVNAAFTPQLMFWQPPIKLGECCTS